MYRAPVLSGCVAEAPQVQPPIAVRNKAGATIVAALDRVNCNAGQR